MVFAIINYWYFWLDQECLLPYKVAFQIIIHKILFLLTKHQLYYHMLNYSIFLEPKLLLKTIFNGDPSIVLAFSSSSSILLNPKSATLILPLCNKRFANLKSLCKILYFVKVLKAFKIYNKNSTASYSVSFFLFFKYSIISPFKLKNNYLHYNIQALDKNY